MNGSANDGHSVAVIGLACRFPGDACNGEGFWQLICKGRSAYSEPDRFNVDAFHSGTRAKLNTSTARGGHFLRQDIAAFDANFFSIGEGEASAMDPQARIMLEIAYEAFENAGLSVEKVAGTDTSCYIGNFTTDYREMLLRDPDFAPLYSLSGSGQELISNRISWFYDLRGPSFTLGTACSSSLVALHQACQSIRTGESGMSIVGGSNLLLNPDMFMMLSNMNFLAQDGTCKSFDAKGDGYGRGEGFAAVVLKNLDDAIRDGDPIRAVIRGTGVNQDGKTKGITVPSATAQANLIRSTYLHAGLDLGNTHYVEAHGTGTKAGDPLELEGISKTLRPFRGQSILVGSVKPNVGHLEATAGLAGLIKAIFILERGLIPPNIHLHDPNPQIPFEEWKISVPTKLIDFPVHGLRRISVQGFGYGGTNAHVILDDALHYLAERKVRGVHRTKAALSTELNHVSHSVELRGKASLKNHSKDGVQIQIEEICQTFRLFVFSAYDREGLDRQKQSFCNYLRSQEAGTSEVEEDQLLRDLAFTLSEKRSQLAWKTYAIASSLNGLLSGLQTKESETPQFRSSGDNRIGFIFTGQGAQWARMGEELNQYPTFRQSILKSDGYLRSALGCTWSAAEEMRRGDAESSINNPEFSQPICTVLQIALVDLLASWNIKPSAIVGHSSGEIAGAYCLGALSREDALKAAYHRGVLSSRMKVLAPSVRGAMLAVGASESQAQEWIDDISSGDVVVACVNSPSSVTLSGDAFAIDELQAKLQEKKIFARKLKVETAYHSPHMDMVSVLYLESLSGIRTQTNGNSRKMYSAVTGCSVESSELGSIYWVRNLVSPVLFYDAIYDLLRPLQDGRRSTENSVDILLEIGPHSTLQGAVNQTMKKHGIAGITYQSVLKRGRNAVETALDAVGFLAAQNVHVDISQVNEDSDLTYKEPPRPLVNLPPYCWNHSRTFWAESRISKEYRFRAQPRLSLLGAPVPKMNETEHTWRGFFRISEQPWIRDHMIQTSILYPAAGYLAMAIEGASQIATRDQIIKDFKLRDVQIVAPAVMSETSDMECILQLRPHRTGTRDNTSTWMEFSVSSCGHGEDLRQNCYGLLVIDYETTKESSMHFERSLEDETAKERYYEVEKICHTTEDPRSFYMELASAGLNYGSTFRNLTQVRRGQGKSCFTLDMFDPDLQAKLGYMDRPHVIHPTNLDSIFHAVFAAYKDENGHLEETMVPTSIDEVIISAKIPFAIGSRLKGFCEASKHGFRELIGNITLLDEHLSSPTVTVKGFRCSGISGTGMSSQDNMELSTRKLFSKMVWKPATEFLSSDQACEVIHREFPVSLGAEAAERFEKCEILAFFFIKRALEEVSIDRVPNLQLRDFRVWLQEQHHIVRENPRSLRFTDKDWTNIDWTEAEGFLEELEEGGADSEALCQIGKHLVQILLGQEDAEQVLRKNDILDRWPCELTGLEECFTKLAEYIELLAHENPGISILDLGTAAGAAASLVIANTSKDSDGPPPTFHYVFSSPTEAESKEAEERLNHLKNYVKFKTVSMSKDPTSHGLPMESFDVIILSVLEDIHDLDGRLVNAKRLLKPGGKLCVIGITNPGMRLSLVLHCLQAMPRESSTRNRLAQIDSKMLEGILAQKKFTPEFLITDFKDSRHQQLSISVSTHGAVLQTDTQGREIAILEAPNPTHAASAMAAQLAIELESRSFKPMRVGWDSDIGEITGRDCVSLIELDTPFLEDLGEKDFVRTKQIVSDASSLLWVTSLESPAAALSAGMARSIRNETSGKRFRTLSIKEKSMGSPERVAPLLTRLIASSTPDSEFVENDGVLQICRVVEDVSMNEEMARMMTEVRERIESIPFEQVQGPQKLAIKAQGMLDSICLEPDDIQGQIEDDEVVIEVRATGLNFRDVMVAMGQIPDNTLGFEASGIITHVGQHVTRFKAGDQVCTLGHGAHRTVFRNKADFCQHIPDGLSFEDAATLPLVHCTAYYSLVHIARVQPKQTILIHAGAGGVGQAAIQIAKHHELEIFATVGSADKRKLLGDLYGIPDDHIFNSRDLSFAKGVLRMTNGRGVDCVINSLSGEALQQTWRCMAPFGTFIEIGLKDILNNSNLEMRPFMQDATFTFINLKHVMTGRPHLLTEILKGTFDYLRQGVTRPVSPVTIYPISEIENAFRLMQTGKHRGKIAISWTGTGAVPVLHRPTASLELSPHASYLLVGGFGGIGRSLAHLLVRLGARYLCFISRSGDKSTEAQMLVRDLRTHGIEIKVYCCDIANKDNLTETFADYTASMPPCKGVFQCAMALRDTLFEKMSHKQWTESLRPKVQGTWNLHSLLPQELDFCIIFSSFAGIFGNRTQSNYAAGGAYEDALAHYRASRGLKAVTIDLGIMRDVGIIAEQGSTGYLKEWEEPFGIREKELHLLIKKIIAAERGDPSTASNTAVPPQILTGFATGGAAQAAGIRTPYYFSDPRFSHLALTGLSATASSEASTAHPLKNFTTLANTDPTAASLNLTAALVERVAKSLQTVSTEIDTGRPLHSYGVDSLVAIEVVNWVLNETKVAVTVFEVLASIPIKDFATKLVKKCNKGGATVGTATAGE
ncbi:MAG: hypothetical protein MMC33_004244 [Icmadophila ericetorum]|nr:hypothetical protein [Icmadophila ericetorum]